jgi:hypothetical protein
MILYSFSAVAVRPGEGHGEESQMPRRLPGLVQLGLGAGEALNMIGALFSTRGSLLACNLILEL